LFVGLRNDAVGVWDNAVRGGGMTGNSEVEAVWHEAVVA